jgi:hypothetical protein
VCKSSLQISYDPLYINALGSESCAQRESSFSGYSAEPTRLCMQNFCGKTSEDKEELNKNKIKKQKSMRRRRIRIIITRSSGKN